MPNKPEYTSVAGRLDKVLGRHWLLPALGTLATQPVHVLPFRVRVPEVSSIVSSCSASMLQDLPNRGD